MRAPDTVRHDNITKGIVFILLSTMASACMNAIMKWFAGSYSTAEIAFFRQAFAMVPVGMLIAFNGGVKLLRTQKPWGHVSRACVGNISLALFVTAYKYLPLSDVTFYNFTAPLFVTALSVPVLKEHVGIHRWSAVLLGFCGVLILINPGSALNIGALITIGAAFTAALAMLNIRHLSRTEHPLTIVFYFTLFGIFAAGLFSIPTFHMPHSEQDWLLMIAIGLFGGLTQYCLTMAYRFAPPSVVAPYNYTTMIWIVMLQYLIWSTLPTGRTFAGAALIILSGLYILYREKTKRIAVASATTLQEAAD